MHRQATFVLDERDLRRAARLHAFSWIRETRGIIHLAVVWMVATAAFAGYCHARGMPWPQLRNTMVVFALLAAVAIPGGALGVPLALSPFAIRRRFRQDKLVRQPVSAKWDEETYEAEQGGLHNRIPWRDYMKLREDDHVFVFFLSDYQFQVLPKRALGRDQIDDIRRVLAAV